MGREQCGGVVLAEGLATAGKGVGLELPGLLVVTQRPQVQAEEAGREKGVGVVLTEDVAAADEGVVLEFPGLRIVTQPPENPGEVTSRGEGVGVVVADLHHWETETADELAELAEDPGDDEVSSPTEAGARAFGHSKDHRADLPQVVIAMAVTRDGVPVRCWTFPGDTADTATIGRLAPTVKSTLPGSGARLRASTAAYSARVPSRCQSVIPNTRCPSESPVVP